MRTYKNLMSITKVAILISGLMACGGNSSQKGNVSQNNSLIPSAEEITLNKIFNEVTISDASKKALLKLKHNLQIMIIFMLPETEKLQKKETMFSVGVDEASYKETFGDDWHIGSLNDKISKIVNYELSNDSFELQISVIKILEEFYIIKIIDKISKKVTLHLIYKNGESLTTHSNTYKYASFKSEQATVVNAILEEYKKKRNVSQNNSSISLANKHCLNVLTNTVLVNDDGKRALLKIDDDSLIDLIIFAVTPLYMLKKKKTILNVGIDKESYETTFKQNWNNSSADKIKQILNDNLPYSQPNNFDPKCKISIIQVLTGYYFIKIIDRVENHIKLVVIYNHHQQKSFTSPIIKAENWNDYKSKAISYLNSNSSDDKIKSFLENIPVNSHELIYK